jgi:hypothetical protein
MNLSIIYRNPNYTKQILFSTVRHNHNVFLIINKIDLTTQHPAVEQSICAIPV